MNLLTSTDNSLIFLNLAIGNIYNCEFKSKF